MGVPGGCLEPVQLRCSQRFSRGPKQRTEYTGTSARGTSSLWIPSCCWLVFHKLSGNRGKSCPRQNSRRVTMWRQWNQHLSLAHPQALPTCPSVHFPMKKNAQWWVTRWLSFCDCATAHLKLISFRFYNSCSIACKTHTLCCSLTATLVARIFLSEFGSATNPWKLQCNYIHGKSRWPLRPSCSLTMKKPRNAHIFTERMEKHISELKFNSLTLFIK